MDKKLFQEPFIEKIEFDSNKVIATSTKRCHQNVTNYDDDYAGVCTSGQKSYTGIDLETQWPD